MVIIVIFIIPAIATPITRVLEMTSCQTRSRVKVNAQQRLNIMTHKHKVKYMSIFYMSTYIYIFRVLNNVLATLFFLLYFQRTPSEAWRSENYVRLRLIIGTIYSHWSGQTRSDREQPLTLALSLLLYPAIFYRIQLLFHSFTLL